MGSFDGTPVRLENEAAIDHLAGWLLSAPPPCEAAMERAAHALLDCVACSWLALAAGSPARLLGPKWGASGSGPVRVLASGARLDPVKAAFDASLLIRWLDLNDTGAAGGHPSDNVGALLAALQYRDHRDGGHARVGDLLQAMCRAYEIQDRLSGANRFDRPEIGIDHVLSVKVASAAVCTKILGGEASHVRSAIGHAFLDGGSLNAYRQHPNAGPRKGWAGADAAARGLWLAGLAVEGEPEVPFPLSAAAWGLGAARLRGEPLRLSAPLGTGAMETVIFKMVPAQRNASTAIEAAMGLHGWLDGRVDDIESVHIATHGEAIRRIVKLALPDSPEAMDHSLQYVVAAALLHGELEPGFFHCAGARDPRLERLFERTVVVEDPGFTAGYVDPDARTLANRVRVELSGGEAREVEVLLPAGDPRRPDSRHRHWEKIAAAHAGRPAGDRSAFEADFADAARLRNRCLSAFLDSAEHRSVAGGDDPGD